MSNGMAVLVFRAWRWNRNFDAEWGVRLIRRFEEWRLLVKLGRVSFSVGSF